MATRFAERNAHYQCRWCNRFQMGEREKYAKAIDKKYGDGMWDELVKISRTTMKLSQFEIDSLIAHYKAEVKRLKAEKGIS